MNILVYFIPNIIKKKKTVAKNNNNKHQTVSITLLFYLALFGFRTPMSSRDQILILIIFFHSKGFSDPLLSSWPYIFYSLSGISILNISRVPQTNHIQTLHPLIFLQKPVPPPPPGTPLT